MSRTRYFFPNATRFKTFAPFRQSGVSRGPRAQVPGRASSNDACLGFWDLVREDLATQHGDWTQAGFHAMLMYRIGNAKPRPWLLAALVRRLYRASHVFVRNMYTIELHASARLGRRVKIAHQGAIVIHGQAVIGDDCVIRQGVTIGAGNSLKHAIAPVLGAGVEVGAGAVVMGGIRVSDAVRIGPNAVVMTDVPAGAIVVASPSRVIPAPAS